MKVKAYNEDGSLEGTGTIESVAKNQYIVRLKGRTVKRRAGLVVGEFEDAPAISRTQSVEVVYHD